MNKADELLTYTDIQGDQNKRKQKRYKIEFLN